MLPNAPMTLTTINKKVNILNVSDTNVYKCVDVVVKIKIKAECYCFRHTRMITILVQI
jgi:hypothetical protein